MKGWLIYNRKDASENKSYIDWFRKEAYNQDIELNLVYRETLTCGIINGQSHILLHDIKVPLPDFAVVRTIDPLLQTYLETFHIHTFNSAATSLISNHKTMTHIEMNKLNIPMVPTYFISQGHIPNLPPLSYPFVVKQATGRGGEQVYYVCNQNKWEQVVQKFSKTDFLIQGADVQLGKDIRVFVIGKKIIAAILRENDNDFRANFKLGGKASLFSLSDQQKRMIQKIIDHFNFGLVGIDFLIGHQNELIFNEIEDVVGSRTLSEVCNINLLKKYVTHIKKTILLN